MLLVSLIGEQPAPNVLPLRHYKPDEVVLIHTARTEALANRIANVIEDEFSVQRPFCVTDPYLVKEIQSSLVEYLHQYGLWDKELVFNLTGGTKTMVYAALEIARQVKAQAFYYQTENNQSLVHPYYFKDGSLIANPPFSIDKRLSLDDYLRLYIGEYASEASDNDLEKAIFQVLAAHQSSNFEYLPTVRLKGLSGNVEVDAVIRYDNQIAALEIKRTAKKSSMDQLNGVTDQRTLGTYTRKILISATPLDENNIELAKAYRIQTIILESGLDGQLSEEDAVFLWEEIVKSMAPRR